jgi:uncharacterized protein YjbI with pentapeptide repeats
MPKQNILYPSHAMIADYAYRMHIEKRKRNQDSTPEQDWLESIEYLRKRQWLVLAFKSRSLLHRIGDLLLVRLPNSRWIQLLAVPIILSITGAYVASVLQENARQYSVLDKYLKDSEVLLSDTEENGGEQQARVKRSLFRTRSIAIINGVNIENKQVIIRLLSELGLISKKNGGISMASLNLKMARLDNLSLDEADLSGTDLSGAFIAMSTLKAANLSGAMLNGSNLQGSNLVAADLSWASLRGAKLGHEFDLIELIQRSEKLGMPASSYMLSMQSLKSANLERAVLENANMENSNLRGVNLREARLRNAMMVNCNLQLAQLETANMREADLRGANLRGARLNNAQLDLANLDNADVKDAVFLDVAGLTVRQIKRARNWEHATYSPLMNSQLGLEPLSAHIKY